MRKSGGRRFALYGLVRAGAQRQRFRCAPALRSDIIPAVRRVHILGTGIDDVTYDEALALCERYMRSGRPHYLVTPNPEFVMRARRDPAFRRALDDASLAIPDGSGLLYAAWLFGTPLRAQVRGTDLAYRLIARGVPAGRRLFLLGAAPGVSEAAAARLAVQFPGLAVAGTYGGNGSPAGDAHSVAHVRAAGRVDLLLVAYGAPKQELWMHRNVPLLDVGLAMGVGGVLDYMAGRVPRAPTLLREAGFEWLYRLGVQPWRWRRQLTLPRFAALVLYAALRRRVRGASGAQGSQG